jgi:hypothetical protein
MEVILIQATTIKSSKTPIEIEDSCHLVKIKSKYYLVKTTVIETDYKHKKINKNERNHKKRVSTT